ncbi:MAG: phenylacetate-CoA oxygenase/reductase subunit PaaK [Acetobacteraceae bacterium]|nr:phenylacetate-CoA oxygenase/reductase subunit PaaK [Acetobacteraceae bacterium]
MAKFHPLKVDSIKRETRDSVVLTLAVPDEHKETFRFRQGQYLTFRAVIDGEEVRRSYSICSGVNEGACRVGIKKVQDGLFSTWVNEALKPGQVLEAMPPMGNFFVPLAPSNRSHYVGFAAGSGITPLLSIIKTTLATEPHSRFSLFYGNRASSTIMFREELEDLKNEHLGNLSVTHILSREHQDLELFNGRICKAKCEQLFKYWLDLGSVDTAFICGPQEMMLEVSESLQEHGLEKRQIKFELFASAHAGQRNGAPKTAGAVKADLCEATVTLDGRSRRFAFEKNTVTILDAATREGMEVPYACKAGVCSTCRAMLVEGQADMDANYALEDYEIARGYILTCQAYPVSDKIVVDFDR